MTDIVLCSLLPLASFPPLPHAHSSQNQQTLSVSENLPAENLSPHSHRTQAARNPLPPHSLIYWCVDDSPTPGFWRLRVVHLHHSVVVPNIGRGVGRAVRNTFLDGSTTSLRRRIRFRLAMTVVDNCKHDAEVRSTRLFGSRLEVERT